MDFSSIFSIIQTIIVLILVLVLANITLRFTNKHMTKHNRIIKVIERVSISNNSTLSIVSICDTYFLMSFTGNDNKILKELDKEDVQAVINEIEKNRDISVINNSAIDLGFLKLKGKITNYFGMRK